MKTLIYSFVQLPIEQREQIGEFYSTRVGIVRLAHIKCLNMRGVHSYNPNATH